MTRAYRWLALSVAIGALALALFARAPKHAPRPAPATASSSPAESLRLEIVGGAIRPERTAVAKGSAITLSVRNRDLVPRRLSLAGYEDRWISSPIPARETTVLRFTADRPGEDFAWLVDGAPAGVFSVTGPHLEEGHR